MDFNALLSMASSKQSKKDKEKINRYSLDLPPAKKEEKPAAVSHSEIIKKRAKENDVERHKTKNKHERIEKEKTDQQEAEEKKKNQFRIPKKKTDQASFINSLFDDDNMSPKESEQETQSPKESEQEIQNKTESSMASNSHTSSSSKNKDRSSGSKHKSSHSSSSSNHRETSSASKDEGVSNKESNGLSAHSKHSKSSSSKSDSTSSKSHSSSSRSHSSSSKSRSSSSKSHSSSSKSHSPSSKSHSSSSKSHSPSSKSHSPSSKSHSSSSKPHSSSSKSHSSSSKSHSSSSKSHSSSSKPSSRSSKSRPVSSSSSAKSSQDVDQSGSSSHSTSSKSPPSSTIISERKPSDERPITLSKHHLNPVAERHASNPYLTEKEKILARLKAIKERTLAAIHKETNPNGKRVRNEKAHRKTKDEVKEDGRVKSKEIIRDIVSSSDEEVPEALDIMLSERTAKLEKEKITRMARQAWDRAMKKGKGESIDDDDIMEKRKRKISKERHRSRKPHKTEKNSHSHSRKERAHSLSPCDEQKRKPAKPKLVRHAGQAAPPPMDFQALLAMAAQKQKAPHKLEPSAPKKKKNDDDKRPMTQEEKERKARVKSKEYQHWLKYGGKRPITKGNEELDDESQNSSPGSSPSQQSSSRDKGSTSKRSISAVSDKPSSYAKYVERENSKVSVSSRNFSSTGNPRGERSITVNENVLVCGSAEESEVDSPSPTVKAAAENPFDRLIKQVHKKKSNAPHGAKRTRIEDSEYEEDEASDLDDFIDDGNDGDLDYSREIKNIFGYDKSRYDPGDDDDSDMEANFTSIMKEEARSAKIGRMEDLEDMRREEEELKRKALLRKKMKR